MEQPNNLIDDYTKELNHLTKSTLYDIEALELRINSLMPEGCRLVHRIEEGEDAYSVYYEIYNERSLGKVEYVALERELIDMSYRLAAQSCKDLYFVHAREKCLHTLFNMLVKRGIECLIKHNAKKQHK